MYKFMIFCYVCFQLSILVYCKEKSTVIRISVPKGHHVRLPCGGSLSSEVVWTHRHMTVSVETQGAVDLQRHLLLSNGSLDLLQLEESDSGEYKCNQELVAKLHVLSGHKYMVSAGWTLLLPCNSSFKHRQRWLHWREGGKRQVIFTRFRNGTTKPESDARRFSYKNDALQILDLQPQDAGQYQCNGNLRTRVSVWNAKKKKEDKKKRREKVHLIVAVIGLGLMLFLMAAACLLLFSMHCGRKNRSVAVVSQKPEDTELQVWRVLHPSAGGDDSLSLKEETIHYASLCRQNCRPSSAPPVQNHQNVIYSAVMTRPVTK